MPKSTDSFRRKHLSKFGASSRIGSVARSTLIRVGVSESIRVEPFQAREEVRVKVGDDEYRYIKGHEARRRNLVKSVYRIRVRNYTDIGPRRRIRKTHKTVQLVLGLNRSGLINHFEGTVSRIQ